MKPHILPAIRTMKDLEKLIETDYNECVLLDTHVGHVKSIMDLLNKHQMKTFIHIDLINYSKLPTCWNYLHKNKSNKKSQGIKYNNSAKSIYY